MNCSAARTPLHSHLGIGVSSGQGFSSRLTAPGYPLAPRAARSGFKGTRPLRRNAMLVAAHLQVRVGQQYLTLELGL